MRVLVTGSSTGLGLGAARALREGGHEVVVHARSSARTGDLDGDWHGLVLGDLADREQTLDLARQADALGPFDAVIHNAGVSGGAVLEVNVVAPYLLTVGMARPARLIYLSSGMHRGGSPDVARLDTGRVSYSDSKLFVTAFAFACAERWPGTVAHAVDPGWVPTRMGGAGAPDDLEAGHATQVWLATADDVVPSSGGYWYHRTTREAHPSARDAGFQAQLLDRLRDLTGVELPAT